MVQVIRQINPPSYGGLGSTVKSTTLVMEKVTEKNIRRGVSFLSGIPFVFEDLHDCMVGEVL